MDLSILGIDPVTALLLVGFVMGFVELVKALFDTDWRKAAVIAVAGVAGAVVAWPLGLNVIMGAVAGLAASGAITLVQNVGSK